MNSRHSYNRPARWVAQEIEIPRERRIDRAWMVIGLVLGAIAGVAYAVTTAIGGGQ